MSKNEERQSDQWEYSLLTRGPSQGSTPQWTHFKIGTSSRTDIRQGGEIPPGAKTNSDQDALNQTIAWLGTEGWEMVGVAVGQGGQLEQWFKRPLTKATAATEVRSY